MTLDRRRFLHAAGGAVAGAWLSPLVTRASAGPRPIKAIAFDAFPIFDPRPVSRLAETLFPGRGGELSGLWRTRQFEYQWLRALTGRYADFMHTTEEGLVFAARSLKLDLSAEKRTRLLGAWKELTTWPDVPSAVGSLRESGLRLALLSNMTGEMLLGGLRGAGLEGSFEQVLSADAIRTYKPDPRAYRMALDAFGLEREEILFVAFAGWDAAGARWFGYPTFWLNRLDAPAEELAAASDGTGRDLNDLVRFVRERRAAGPPGSRPDPGT
jgi:2-haloacid dehalogenase